MGKLALCGAMLCGVLFSYPGLTQTYDYDVSGYRDDGTYLYGEIEAQGGNRDVEGYLYTDDGDETYFEGEWTGRGEIEGYDEEGNYINLETD